MSFNPYPTPEEQLRQVMAWYPNKKLYRRRSSKSEKDMVSIYSETSACPVYTHEEWYADDWTSPFLEVDFSRSFFDQFKELQSKAPVVGLLSTLQENAEYCQDVEGLKNSYLVFDAILGRDLYYCTRIYNSNSCVDCYWILDSELLYDSTYMFSCYNCRYSFNCKQASDSAFLFDCRNTQHSFMSSGLRNKGFYVFNKPVSKDEYEAFLKTVDFSNYEQMEGYRKQFLELIRSTPSPTVLLENCEDVEGNYVKNSKNCTRCLESYELQDCHNVFQCAKGKNIEGSFMCNDRVERCTQSVATGISSFDVQNCAFVWHSSAMQYCYLCIGCQDCFGCIGLRNKKYHIFNKAYSKEDYEQLIPQLIEGMKNRGEYGFFFPMELSPFKYEDTIAYDFFSEESSAVEMKLNYTPQELEFYRKNLIPLPKKSFPERYRDRLRMMDTSLSLVKGTYYKHPKERVYSFPGIETDISQRVDEFVYKKDW